MYKLRKPSSPLPNSHLSHCFQPSLRNLSSDLETKADFSFEDADSNLFRELLACATLSPLTGSPQSLYNGLLLRDRPIFDVAVLESNELICVFVKLQFCPFLLSLLSALLDPIPPVLLVRATYAVGMDRE